MQLNIKLFENREHPNTYFHTSKQQNWLKPFATMTALLKTSSLLIITLLVIVYDVLSFQIFHSRSAWTSVSGISHEWVNSRPNRRYDTGMNYYRHPYDKFSTGIYFCSNMIGLGSPTYEKSSRMTSTSPHYRATALHAKPGKDIDSTNDKIGKNKATKTKKKGKFPLVPIRPEFSRIINAAQVPARKPVICKIVAKEKELAALATRLKVPGLKQFTAEITLSRTDATSILVEGTIVATVYNGEMFPEDEISEEFDTVILDNSSLSEKISIEDAVDYDDEVGHNGDIDIGEIASQYLSMEIF